VAVGGDRRPGGGRAARTLTRPGGEPIGREGRILERMRWVIGLLAALVAASSSPGAATDSVDATKRVVREWSARVNAYDNDGVARLFARPAAVAQGGAIYALRTYEEIALWHRTLPCAARIVSITVKGQDATAVFVLRNGPHRRCDAPGGKVAAVFRISGGKIRAWAQIPVPKPVQPVA
jgi:limonene-1,2-epoxide hydrolase